MDQGHLYERAGGPNGLGPLWHLGGDRTFFAGPLRHNTWHQHGAPVFLAGLYDTFALRLGDGAWQRTAAALIPAGMLHELDVGGWPIAVFYLEPLAGGAGRLAPLMRNTWESQGALLGTTDVHALMRALWEDGGSAAWAGEALEDALGGRRAPCDGTRITRAVAALHAGTREDAPEGLVSIAAVAAAAGLSPSRFQHLFTREMGVPFRRYRAWLRMRRAIEEVARGASFTTAAHAAGFADQSHFTHDFRRTFGAPPSASLLRVRA
ncbi:AraC-like DNA-binding protein [Nitrospirillum viridazoti]|uniref:AraC-like DNA-binding protein n=1 Tax=Nitrospirillum amazonense TaxID=28077 RepID=A0A560IDZ0_9PROT|nr:AraC-like DNA-binding protein [Nitrospirillum amazonense]